MALILEPVAIKCTCISNWLSYNSAPSITCRTLLMRILLHTMVMIKWAPKWWCQCPTRTLQLHSTWSHFLLIQVPTTNGIIYWHQFWQVLPEEVRVLSIILAHSQNRVSLPHLNHTLNHAELWEDERYVCISAQVQPTTGMPIASTHYTKPTAKG